MSSGLLEEVANLRRSRLELLVKVLDVEGAGRRGRAVPGRPGPDPAPAAAMAPGHRGLGGRLPEQLRVQPGRALATLGGPGWGPVVRELLAADGPVPDELLEAVVRVLGRWDWPERPTWVTFVPSRRHPKLVEDLARRIADVGRLPLHQVLERTREGPPQLEMANSAHQCRNVHGAFAITGPIPQDAVLLVDDTADSKWTLTIAGALLRHAGAGPVFPLALLRRGPD